MKGKGGHGQNDERVAEPPTGPRNGNVTGHKWKLIEWNRKDCVILEESCRNEVQSTPRILEPAPEWPLAAGKRPDVLCCRSKSETRVAGEINEKMSGQKHFLVKWNEGVTKVWFIVMGTKVKRHRLPLAQNAVFRQRETVLESVPGSGGTG